MGKDPAPDFQGAAHLIPPMGVQVGGLRRFLAPLWEGLEESL